MANGDPADPWALLAGQLQQLSRQYAEEQEKLITSLRPAHQVVDSLAPHRPQTRLVLEPRQRAANPDVVVKASSAASAEVHGAGSHPMLGKTRPSHQATLDWTSAVTKHVTEMHDHHHPHVQRLIRRIPCCSHSLEQAVLKVLALKEPLRRGRLASVVRSGWFQTICLLVIMANAGVIIHSSNWAMANIGQDEPTEIIIFGHLFTAFYTLELLLKLSVHRLYFFVNVDGAWNTFDFVLVTFSYMEFLLNATFLRIVRLVKVGRMARMLKALRALEDLRTILDSLLGCMYTMFWSLVLLAFLLCLFGIFFVQMGVTHASSEGLALDQTWWTEYQRYFSSVFMCMLTLLGCTTGGEDWIDIHRLVYETGSIPGAVLVFFIVFFTLAVYNIVMTSFIDRAVKSTRPTMAENLERKQAEDQVFAVQLYRMLFEVDWDGDGYISIDEFREAMSSDNQLAAFLKFHGLDIKDCTTFFAMLSPSATSVSFIDFVQACCRMRGSASSMDVSLVSFEVKLLLHRQKRLQDELQKQFNELTCRMPHPRASSSGHPEFAEQLDLSDVDVQPVVADLTPRGSQQSRLDMGDAGTGASLGPPDLTAQSTDANLDDKVDLKAGVAVDVPSAESNPKDELHDFLHDLALSAQAKAKAKAKAKTKAKAKAIGSFLQELPPMAKAKAKAKAKPKAKAKASSEAVPPTTLSAEEILDMLQH